MERTIAVVGTRKASPYGITATEKIVTDLTLSGIVIVSGMAYGIDAAAHHAAISAGGKTIAVLGCGVDIIAPSVNADIYKKLTEEGYGAVISEMPLGLRPSKGLFPSRNRIISGLSRGVVVVEGASDSGALITARYAAEQGRDVFAVPGPITSTGSQASSLLLRQGAILTENADDVVSQLGIAKSGKPSHNTKRIEWQSKDEEKVGDALSRGPLDIDELVAATGLTINTISSTLTLLEVKGIVKDTGGKVYQLL
jgi:DNA processing protein